MPDAPNPTPIRQARCPYCGREFEYKSVAEHKPFPFCSARCRDVDLGKWFSGAYAIPGEELPADPDEATPERDAT
ncbi:MAG TPA: DNA gyrase inhibitor YacG [Planctomycetota bacterium]|nr:DNA gyrase inhibitor YacG [Planctomycetota bacterium]